MSGTTIVEGGTVVTHEATFRADLVIHGERISGLIVDGSLLEADQRIDASGLLVLPGGIDSHTHFEEPDPQLLEGFTTGGCGAAAGGITTVIEMPQAHPTTTTPGLLGEKQQVVHRNAIVDMALWAGVVGEPAQSAEELSMMAAAGAAGFKAFMASSSPFFPAVNTAQLLKAMQTISETGLPFALHAEDMAMVDDGLRRMREAGRGDPLAHAESRPPEVEAVAVNTALFLAELTGCAIHVCHAASAKALQLVTEARARGVPVTVETCPQYLVLNTEDLTRLKGFARCAPAIRDQTEVDAIWPFVLAETVDFVCSDHSPYPVEVKQQGDENIFNAPMGLSGIQTLLPIFFDSAVNQRGMDLSQFVRQISTNAARIFGLYPRKGTIAVGSDADLTLFDPRRTWTVHGGELQHRQKWSPWEGKTLTGRVIRTLRRGETIFDDASDGTAKVMGQPGSGRLLAPGYGMDVA